jgi:hypothetical protein
MNRLTRRIVSRRRRRLSELARGAGRGAPGHRHFSSRRTRLPPATCSHGPRSGLHARATASFPGARWATTFWGALPRWLKEEGSWATWWARMCELRLTSNVLMDCRRRDLIPGHRFRGLHRRATSSGLGPAATARD